MRRIHLAVLVLFVLVLAAVPSALGRGAAAKAPTAIRGMAQGPETQWGRELPELRTRTSRTYLTDAGIHRSVLTQASSNYANASGAWQPIDNTLVAASGGFENRANRYRVELPSTLAQPVRISEGGRSLSFALQGAGGMATVNGSTAIYSGALPGVDVEYSAGPDAVEETLILSSAAAPSTFAFSVQASAGLSVKQVGRSLAIGGGQGPNAFALVPPFMVDAAGVRSDDVTFKLAPAAQGYLLTLTADPKWLADPARRYPVRIDPTATISPPSTDCSLKSAPSADSIFCNATVVPMGYDGRQLRGIFKFDLATTMPRKSEVLYAHLDLFLQAASGTNAVPLETHTLTRAFTQQATWNKYDGTNAWTTPGGDFDPALAGPTQSVGATTGAWTSWQLTNLTALWQNQTAPNYGVLLKEPAPETTSQLLDFTSSEAGGTNGPRLVIDHVIRTGLRRHHTHERFKLTDRMDAAVHVSNGNLVVTNNDLHLEGTGIDFDFVRTYNSMSAVTGSLGSRWTSSATPRLHVSADGSIDFTQDDGAIVPFIWNPDGSFTSPTAIDATLTKNGDGTYKLKFNRDDVTYNFGVASGGISSLTSKVDANGNTIQFNAGLTTVVDSQNRTTTFLYTGGLLTKITDPASRTYQYAYTGGNLTTYTDPAGKVTTYAYDGSGRMTQITDPMTRITKFGYDAFGRLATVTRVTNNGAGTGPVTTFTYLDIDAACPSNTSGVTTVTDPNSHDTKYCYDSQLRVTRTIDAMNRVRSATYTANSDVATFTDGAGKISTSSYSTDGRNNLLSSTSPTGAHSDYQYTDAVNPFSQSRYTSAQGNFWGYKYDVKNNLTEKNEGAAAANPVKFGYSAKGLTTSLTNAKAGITTNTPTANGFNIASSTPPSPLGASSYTYDSLGRIATAKDGKSQTTVYTYDLLGRVKTLQYKNSAGVVQATITYTYDDDGNVLTRVDNTGTSTYTYDALNRLTQEQKPSGTTSYGYDSASNLASLTDAGGTVTYAYNAADDLTTLTQPGGAQITFGYDAEGRRNQTNYPNDVSSFVTYDDSGRIATIIGKKVASGTVYTSFTYSNCTTAAPCAAANDRDLRQSVTDKDGNKTSYTYDVNERLAGAQTLTSGGGAVSNYQYAYDPNGNMSSRTVTIGAGAPTTTAYTVNAGDQLTGTGYAHDLNGNMTTGPSSTAFTWNIKDQASNLQMSGNSESTTFAGPGQTELTARGAATFHNDIFGKSVRTEPSEITYYTRDNDGQVLSQRQKDPATGTIRHYYYLFDGLGSIVAQTDQDGFVEDTYKYDPYGNDIGSTNNEYNAWRFAGGYYSVGLKLYQFGERWYDPATQRWPQQDSIDDPLAQKGWNRYDYAGDDPVNSADPAGTKPLPPGCSRSDSDRGWCHGRAQMPGKIHPIRRTKRPAKRAFIAACGIRTGWGTGKAMLVKRGVLKVGSKFIPVFDVPCAAYGVYEAARAVAGK